MSKAKSAAKKDEWIADIDSAPDMVDVACMLSDGSEHVVWWRDGDLMIGRGKSQKYFWDVYDHTDETEVIGWMPVAAYRAMRAADATHTLRDKIAALEAKIDALIAMLAKMPEQKPETRHEPQQTQPARPVDTRIADLLRQGQSRREVARLCGVSRHVVDRVAAALEEAK